MKCKRCGSEAQLLTWGLCDDCELPTYVSELEAEVERYKEALKICAEYLEGPCNIPNDCPACKAWDAVQAVLQEGE